MEYFWFGVIMRAALNSLACIVQWSHVAGVDILLESWSKVDVHDLRKHGLFFFLHYVNTVISSHPAWLFLVGSLQLCQSVPWSPTDARLGIVMYPIFSSSCTKIWGNKMNKRRLIMVPTSLSCSRWLFAGRAGRTRITRSDARSRRNYCYGSDPVGS